MNTIRISRKFAFEASHALQASDGHCKPIHVHTYQLTVTLLGEPKQNGDDHKLGMVMNFSDLQRLVESHIITPWEHALLLHEDAPAGLIDSWKKIDKKLVLLHYQPTCENLLLDVRDKLMKHLPDTTFLHSVRLAESATTLAEWHASDNLLYEYKESVEEDFDNLLVQDCLTKANAAVW